jgi:hypothetical protein
VKTTQAATTMVRTQALAFCVKPATPPTLAELSLHVAERKTFRVAENGLSRTFDGS